MKKEIITEQAENTISRDLEEDLVTTLAYSDKYGRLLVPEIKPELWSNRYRPVVERLLSYWEKYDQAPKQSAIRTIFKKELNGDDPAKRKNYERILKSMIYLADQLNYQFALDQLREHDQQARVKDFIVKAAEMSTVQQLGATEKALEFIRDGLDKFSVPTAGQLQTFSLDQFPRRKAKWLWYPYFPIGVLTALFGDGGKGKSTITLDLAARITLGKPWPLTDPKYPEPAPKGSVLIMSAEEAPNEIIRPKVEDAGADLSKVHLIGYTKDAADTDSYQRLDRIDTKLRQIERCIEQIGDLKLVVIDPINSFLGDTDANSDAKVRELLGGLLALAAKHQLSIVYIMHLNKKTDLAGRQRALGSVGFTNLARSAVAVGDDPEGEGRKIMTLDKFNYVREGIKAAIGFETEETRRGSVALNWGDEWLDYTSDDILSQPKTKRETKTNKIEDMLREMLKSGPRAVHVIQARAAAMNVSWRTVVKVKDRIGINSERRSEGWWWSLK